MSGPFDVFGLGADPEKPEESPARKAQIASARPLPKRFYEDVCVVEEGGGFHLRLDGRAVKTPARQNVILTNAAVAEAVAEEWRKQVNVIDPKIMPLTRLLNSALDGVANTMESVADEITRFSGTDLLCYRAENPERLVALQNDTWDPILKWVEQRYDCRFHLAGGIMHVVQPVETVEAIAKAVSGIKDPLQLAALHSMTSLMGSCLLALAIFEKEIEPEKAWMAAHLDEDWNIEQWGRDEEAEARRAYRWADMQAASFIVLNR